MYRLYGSPGSGSAAVEAALAEVGADHQVTVVKTSDGEHRTDAFRVINPRQQVPALQLPDGSVMSEGAAMLLHLADAFPATRLAPLPGTSARAQHDRWLIFMAVNIYEAELRKAYCERYTDDAGGTKAVASNADTYIKRHYAILEQAIGSGPHLFGAELSMADIYLWTLASWVDADWLARHCPKVARLAAIVRQRPLVAPIHAAHF